MRIDYPRRGRDGWRRFIPSWRQWLGIFALGGAALVAAFVALYLLIDVPEPNAAGVALAERHGLVPVFETARMYRGQAPHEPVERIFAVPTFELG